MIFAFVTWFIFRTFYFSFLILVFSVHDDFVLFFKFCVNRVIDVVIVCSHNGSQMCKRRAVKETRSLLTYVHCFAWWCFFLSASYQFLIWIWICGSWIYCQCFIYARAL